MTAVNSGDLVPVGVLGSGTFGTVFLVRCSKSEKEYALKVIRCAYEADLKEAVNDYRVGLLMGQEDIGVVVHCCYMFTEDLHDTQISEEQARKELHAGRRVTVGILMDKMPMTLMQHVKERGKGMRVEEKLALARELSRLVRAMHSHGYVHRDVKLANVLYDPASGRMRLADFGSAARALGRKDQPLWVRSETTTCTHRSPAAFADPWASLTPAADLWSAGYAALTLALDGVDPLFGAVRPTLNAILAHQRATRERLGSTADSREEATEAAVRAELERRVARGNFVRELLPSGETEELARAIETLMGLPSPPASPRTPQRS